MSISHLTTAEKTVAVEVVTITPELAEEWLKKNVKNRPFKEAKIRSYTRDMTRGHWHLNGETIKFDLAGNLIDGQNRLRAVMVSGAAVQMLVVRNLPYDVQATIDVGAKRSFSDQLHLDDEKNASALAAVLRRAVMWDNGYRLNVGGYQPTESELRDYLLRWPGIRYSAEVANRGRRYVPIPASILGLAHHLFYRVDVEMAEAFFLKLIDGLGVELGDPVYALRRRLADESARGGRIRETHVLAYVITTWNHSCSEARITKLQAPKGGWTNENFPSPRGPKNA